MSKAVVGRDEELSAVSTFLDALPDGPAILLLEGEPGIGKSTIWEEAKGRATDRGFLTLTARPNQSEAHTPFAGLGDLLGGVGEDTYATLPDPQRRALEVALLKSEGGGQPLLPRAVGLGLLGILHALAEETVVLVAVDDLHWLDRSSAQAIEFAMRRASGKIGLLVSQRPAPELAILDLARATIAPVIINVGPMGPEELGRIMRSHVGMTLPRGLILKIARATGGNPFFALEVARALERRGSLPGPAEPLPVPRTLRELVRDRLVGLPDASKMAVLAATALASPSAEAVEEVAAGEGAGALGLAVALESGVLELDGDWVRLTHPLLGSVLYSETPPAERRELHRRLAQVTPDREERALHFALAADAPGEKVAAALDGAAERACRRGAPEAAAELYEQSRRLTPRDDAEDRRRRGLLAGELHLEGGDLDRAAAVLGELAEESAPGALTAEVLLRLGWVVSQRELSGPSAAGAIFWRAREEAPAGSSLRGEIELALAWARHAEGALLEALGHAGAALRIARTSGSAGLEAQALAAVAFWNAITGEGPWREAMAQAEESDAEDGWTWALGSPRWLSGVVRIWEDDLEGSASILESMREEVADSGDVQLLPFLLGHLARIDLLTGSWERARERLRVASDLCLDSGQRGQRLFMLSWSALIEAHFGDGKATERLAEEIREATAGDAGYLREIELRPALGLLELSRGDPQAAWDQLSPLAGGIGDEIHHPGVLRFEGNAIEALLELGRSDDAERALESLERRGMATGSRWAEAVAARCRGLLLSAKGHSEDAARTLEDALVLQRVLPYPFEEGRTLLSLGRVQRRCRRWGAARESLVRALEIFEDLGAGLWSQRSRDELERIGGRAPEPWGLTPTEERLAALVAEGMTNREAADALSVAVKTVEGNLTRIYRKLGVRSRAELTRRVLEGTLTSPP